MLTILFEPDIDTRLLSLKVVNVNFISYEEIHSALNLVDPASSDMLVSKIKPCMCKFILINCETANGSIKQLQLVCILLECISIVILWLIHTNKPTLWKVLLFQI